MKVVVLLDLLDFVCRYMINIFSRCRKEINLQVGWGDGDDEDGRAVGDRVVRIVDSVGAGVRTLGRGGDSGDRVPDEAQGDHRRDRLESNHYFSLSSPERYIKNYC